MLNVFVIVYNFQLQISISGLLSWAKSSISAT